MRLIIGGANQGKLKWYLSQNPSESEEIMDGDSVSLEKIPPQKIFYHFHRWVFRQVESVKDPMPLLKEYLSDCPDAVIICDEIGCGVVPIQPIEREWREMTGRLCCYLAKQATCVDRIFCGLSMNLKKEG